MKFLAYAKVSKKTRASKDGTRIFCPHCKHAVVVHHFGWEALSCQKCGKDVPKTEWLIVEAN